MGKGVPYPDQCSHTRPCSGSIRHGKGRDAPKASIEPSVLFVHEDHLFGSRPDITR